MIIRMLGPADATLYLAKADGRARYSVFDAKRKLRVLAPGSE